MNPFLKALAVFPLFGVITVAVAIAFSNSAETTIQEYSNHSNYTLNETNATLDIPEEKIINFTGQVEAGKYTIYMMNDSYFNSLQPDLQNVLGYTYGEAGWTGRIWIRTNRTYETIYETCVHEILHNIVLLDNTTLEEEVVEWLAERLGMDECNRLMERILK